MASSLDDTFRFSDLPTELIIRVIEEAAVHKPTACSLSLVSKNVQALSDKYLFYNVTSDYQNGPMAWMMKWMVSNPVAKSSRLQRARSFLHVFRSLSIGKKLLPKILARCPNLSSLSVTRLHPTVLDVSHPKLCQLQLQQGGDLYSNPDAFSDALFDGITHLSLNNTFIDLFPIALWSLPQLTHLHMRYNYHYHWYSSFSVSRANIVQPWTHEVPPQVVIIFIEIVLVEDRALLLKVLLEGQVDIRFVLLVEEKYLEWAALKSRNGFIARPYRWDFQWLDEEGWQQGRRLIETRRF
ncbi:hypothetical protein DL96DRAFT_1706505 [Flagelloscypha sp. PMI_526]|nr:hypothetical protein DL96DRAFT_1706505 [Flagelloscypha sp. PMI_526]